MSATTYCLRVEAHLDDEEAGWFEGLRIANEPNGEATLTGPVPDQAALHGLLNQVFGLNLTLISVNRLEPAEPPPSPAGLGRSADNPDGLP